MSEQGDKALLVFYSRASSVPLDSDELKEKKKWVQTMQS